MFYLVPWVMRWFEKMSGRSPTPVSPLSPSKESGQRLTREGPGPLLRRQTVQGGCGLARHWFRGRFQASALPLVKLWAVLRSEGHPAGGVGPACRSIRGRIRASTGPLVRLGPLRRRFLPREAGLRRQSRHPRKANTERRSGRGTRVGGVIPFGFCCPAAI